VVGRADALVVAEPLVIMLLRFLLRAVARAMGRSASTIRSFGPLRVIEWALPWAAPRLCSGAKSGRPGNRAKRRVQLGRVQTSTSKGRK
jgi:hypothetical protein